MSTQSIKAIEQANPQICEWIFNVVNRNKVLKIFLSQNIGFAHQVDVTCFHANETDYFAFCDDFGPMNFASVASFIEDLDREIVACSSPALVYCARKGRRALTNAAFLLGAYMVLRLNTTPCEVSRRFEGIGEENIEDYRDATFSPPDFGLRLIDCWAGLHRAMESSWLAPPTRQAPQTWGKIDIDEYAHYEDPLNGDLHEVVPGKLIAFKGPKDLRGRVYTDDVHGHRTFSPTYYGDIFRELGVSTVVRLNEARYSARAFTDAGIEHHDLYFDDCTAPPKHVVERFFRILDAAPGLVAVHCKAGLGRTGTLVALHLMRAHGFAAREAMGWLRVVRPGCVIGEQQHYLCEVERSLRELRGEPGGPPPAAAVAPRSRDAPPRTPPPSVSAAAAPPRRDGAAAATVAKPPPAAAVLAAQVAAGMARRGATRAASWLARRPSGLA
jgi:cell division cycle 14